MTARLIVNADDFGLTPGVSEGIVEAHLHGIVTSTSVMMNRPNAARSIQETQETCPRLGMGVHLVLTVGAPLLPPAQIPSLVQPNGQFLSLDVLIQNIDRLDIAEVIAELRAQIERFVQISGHSPDHLDTHHHTAYFAPHLFEVLCQLAAELDCPIRLPFSSDPSLLTDYLKPSNAPGHAAQIQAILAEYHPRHPDVFIVDWYGNGATRENLLANLAQIATHQVDLVYELMCHPAHVDNALLEISSYTTQRVRERLLLQDPDILAYIETAGIELIPFSKL